MTESLWYNFKRLDFTFKGREATLIVPDKPNENKNWLFKTEYFHAFPEFEAEMVKRGWHLAYIKNITRWCLDSDLDLKREFNNALDYKTKKGLVLKMKELTEEPMPELKLRQVCAEIKYTKERIKIGLFKKKDVIHFTVVVKDNESLPCEALLNISNKVQIKSSEGDSDCIAYEIEKGNTKFEVDLESSNCILDLTKPIYCYLFVGKNVLDKSAIKCDSIRIV